MKIAQIAPLYESVPPRHYGGTERVVSYLTEALVDQGHQVTLFASGDSVTRAKLVPACARSLRTFEGCVDPLAYFSILMDKVLSRSSEFDILHFHIDHLHFPFTKNLALPGVTTLHGRLDLSDLQPLYRHFRNIPVISISRAQRKPIPFANWVGNVYHGLPRDLHIGQLQERGDSYVAFLGRISPEKRPDRAIRIAQKAGVQIRIAAKIDAVDRLYFEREIRPLLALPHVEFLGEIDETQKGEFLKNARAFLFPIDWPEPFGLVTIEAMSCGTPTIAFRCGSVPEIIEDGISGFIVESEKQAVEALKQCRNFDRRACRAEFEKRFTADRMASDYVKIYRSTIDEEQPPLAEALLQAGSSLPR
ncbi:MAG: glycosyltransferase family 4 protein [Terriglobales bacterium]|jgi:glycosyltransferase involved in cell wall biosynthesis